MNLSSFFVPAAAALLVSSLSAAADTTITVSNYDFSSPDVYDTIINQTHTVGDSSTITDWTTGGGNPTNPGQQSWGLINNTAAGSPYTTPNSEAQFAYINAIAPGADTANPSTTDTLTSDLSGANFVIGDTYNLSVYVSANAGAPPDYASTTPDATLFVELPDNGVVVDTGTVAATAVDSLTFTQLSLASPYVAADTGAIGIIIGITAPSDSSADNEQADFADVQLSYSSPEIPEPSATALLLGGAALAAFVLRRRLV